MSDLHEIVNVEAVGRMFTLLAFLLPAAGALIGAGVGARSGHSRNGLLRGFVIGLVGPLNWLLWRTYNAITERNGLDTVRNLVINLILFVVVGTVIGIAVGSLTGRSSGRPVAEAVDSELQE